MDAGIADVDVDVDDYDAFTSGAQQCPYPFIAAMHASGGVVTHTSGAVTVVGMQLVRDVLRNTATFSSRLSNEGTPPPPELAARLREVMSAGWPRVDSLIRLDPPEHTPHRRLVNALLSLRRVAALDPFVTETAHRLAAECEEDLAAGGTTEFVSRFAVPLPLQVVCRVLGIPSERQADVKRWSDDAVAALGHHADPDQRVRTARSLVEFQQFVADALDNSDHTDGLHVLADGDLDLPTLMSLARQVMVAGNETTTNLLAEGMWLLVRRPDLWTELRDDRTKLEPFIEELLRVATPTQGFFRVATADTRLGNVPIASGTRVRVSFAGADRDPSVFADPGEFRLDRTNAGEHLAFGFGPHFCAGAALARLEARRGFDAVLDVLQRPRAVVGYEPEYRPSAALRGLVRLDLAAV